MRRGKIAYELSLIALFAALISVSSLISIPLAVPITLQTLAIYLALYLIGPRRATLSVLLYISIGAVGLPVFSGMTGGVSRILDASGGFILGFVPLTLIYWLAVSLLPRRPLCRVIASVLSLIALYASGTIWYAFVYLSGAHSISAVLLTAVVPFIIPDLLKIVLALILASRIPKHLIK